jgi:glycosyltransferase involved in cell wall biosynthesis
LDYLDVSGVVGKQMKLLIVVGSLKHFVSHYLPLARAAQVAGYEVHVAGPISIETAILKTENFYHHAIPLSRRSINLYTEIKTLLALLHLYNTLRPDVVHHFTIKPAIYGGIAARLTKVKAVVTTITGTGYVFVAHGLKPALLRFFLQPIYRFALNHENIRIIFQNKTNQEYFLSEQMAKVANSVLVRGAGVDMQQFAMLPEPAGVVTIILASRMLWDKGVGEFIKAAQQLQQENIKARFVLAGAPDEENPSTISVSQLQLWADAKIIEWWGWQEDMLAVFAQAHIVCLPSYGEGIPRVLIEAAACGKPIVTTDAAGCNEIVNHQKNGLLVPVRDVTYLAAALQQLIIDQELRKEFGRQGRAMVEQEFAIEKVIDATLSVYQSLIE